MKALRLVKPASEGTADVSDAVLVLEARAGERPAAEALFRRHATRINVLAFRLLGRDADVDDLVQETFARAFASLDSLREPGAFGGWLQGILVRTALAWIRRRRIMARLGFGREALRVDLDQVCARVASPDQQIALRRAYAVLQSLPAEVRVAIVLHRIDGMTLEDVAKATGLSLATVKRRIAVGQRALEEGA